MTRIKGLVGAGLVAGVAAITTAQTPQAVQSAGALRPRPDGVLSKLYYGNALKRMPAVPRTGFPQDGLAGTARQVSC